MIWNQKKYEQMRKLEMARNRDDNSNTTVALFNVLSKTTQPKSEKQEQILRFTA